MFTIDTNQHKYQAYVRLNEIKHYRASVFHILDCSLDGQETVLPPLFLMAIISLYLGAFGFLDWEGQ